MPSMYRDYLKPIFDRIAAAILLTVISPVMVITAILVRRRLGAPVLFRQQRPGLHGKPFMLVKFRTMTDERDTDGNLLPDAERLPAFGKMLRSTSLDELPELWNVLRGEMSFVGPRPLLMRYLERYSPEQARRHEVRPGITGWAQVNGRNAVAWKDRFALDVWYVDHVSFLLDVRVLVMTVGAIFKREGISQEGHATMQEFEGNFESNDE